MARDLGNKPLCTQRDSLMAATGILAEQSTDQGANSDKFKLMGDRMVQTSTFHGFHLILTLKHTPRGGDLTCK